MLGGCRKLRSFPYGLRETPLAEHKYAWPFRIRFLGNWPPPDHVRPKCDSSAWVHPTVQLRLRKGHRDIWTRFPNLGVDRFASHKSTGAEVLKKFLESAIKIGKGTF